METKQLNCSLSLKAMSANGFFSGYASVFDIEDSQHDIILRGAFLRTLRERQATGNPAVKLLWQHHTDEPIGVFTTLQEDAHGLYVEGVLQMDVQRGREAHSLLLSGALEGLSIGYTAVKYHYDADRRIRYLTDVDLWEVSLVTFPSNPAANVTQVKDALQDYDMHALHCALGRAIRALA